MKIQKSIQRGVKQFLFAVLVVSSIICLLEGMIISFTPGIVEKIDGAICLILFMIFSWIVEKMEKSVHLTEVDVEVTAVSGILLGSLCIILPILDRLINLKGKLIGALGPGGTISLGITIIITSILLRIKTPKGSLFKRVHGVVKKLVEIHLEILLSWAAFLIVICPAGEFNPFETALAQTAFKGFLGTTVWVACCILFMSIPPIFDEDLKRYNQNFIEHRQLTRYK